MTLKFTLLESETELSPADLTWICDTNWHKTQNHLQI